MNDTIYKRVLCVGDMGMTRSATVASVLTRPPYCCDTRVVGIHEDALVRFTHDLEELLYWANEIVCMEESQKNWISRQYPHIPENQYIVLGIKTRYTYMQPVLVAMIKNRYETLIAAGDSDWEE